MIHIFGVQQVMLARGADVGALDDIALAIDLLSAPESGKDFGRAQFASTWAAADVPGLLCRLRFREALLKVATEPASPLPTSRTAESCRGFRPLTGCCRKSAGPAVLPKTQNAFFWAGTVCRYVLSRILLGLVVAPEEPC